jgi:hypothetical protein
MKTFLTSVFSVAAVLIMGLANAHAVTTTDDFSDLNDTANPAWTHLSGFVLSTGQAWDASTGQYHLTAPNNGFVSGTNQFGFVGSYTGPVSTNVIVTTDFVQNENGAAYGVGARMNGLNGAFNSANRLQGYVYAYEATARGGLGEMVMYHFGSNPFNPFEDMGDPAGVEGVDWIRKVTLDVANKDYRFSLSAIGNTITGVVSEIGGGVVAYQTHTDSLFTSGYSGVIAVGITSTTSGAFLSDITVDNFVSAEVPEPATGLLVAFGAGAMLLSRRYPRKH